MGGLHNRWLTRFATAERTGSSHSPTRSLVNALTKIKYDNLNTVQRRSLAHGAATAVEWHALGDVTCKSIHEIPTGFFVPNK